MNTALLKKLTIGGSYGLALACCLLALPQYKTQTPQTIGQTLDSVDRALNDPNAPAEIAISAEPARHPLAPVLVRASVWLAIIGTGGVVWSLFGREEQHSSPQTPPFLLPPAFATSAPALPYPIAGDGGCRRLGDWGTGGLGDTGESYRDAFGDPTTENRNTSPPSPRPPNEAKRSESPHPPVSPSSTPQWDFEQRRGQLFGYLANSPSAWLLQLLEATPILIWGEQRSGKTELAQIIALLRKIFFFHDIEVNDPHEHINDWLPCFPVFGGDFNYEAIDSRLIAYRQRLKASPRGKKPVTSIWDEFTQYAENCTCQKTQEFDFIKSVAAESQKKEEFPILISHGRTSTAKGGTTGTDEMFENGFIQIHLLAKRSPTGRAMPSGRGFLKGLSKDANGKPEQFAIELPPWLRAMALYQYFPELHNPAPSSHPEQYHHPTPPSPTASSSNSQYAHLAEHLDNLIESETLSAHLQAIWKLARQRGEPLKARDVQRAPLSLLRNLDAETIRSAFRELEALGKGHCQGEGTNLSFVTSPEESH